jgi:hypothetical protein
MPGDVLAHVDVEVVRERSPLGGVGFRERVDERVPALLDADREVRIELDAVARREHGVLVDLRTAIRADAERLEPLPQLDGSRPVTDSETDEAIHSGRRTLLGVER